MTEPRRFVVLSARRSGSNMLCTILGAHPDVLCHHELFNPHGIFVALELRRGAPTWEISARERDPLGFLACVWAATHGRARVGFKMTLRQAPRILDAVLDDPGIDKLVLRREDLLRAFVSERIAEALGEWEVYDPEALARDRPRVRVDPEALRSHVEATHTYYDDITMRLRDGGQRWLELRYEALETAQEQRRMFEFLGVTPPSRLLPPRSVRQNHGLLTAMVSNHAELAKALRDDPLARFLDPSS
jgi:LPS sulfotransferase NodH